MKNTFAFLLLTCFFISCEKESTPVEDEFVTAKKDYHHGKVWSWYKQDAQGKPDQLGITIDDAALNSVPEPTTTPGGGHTHGNSVVVAVPSKAIEQTPFRSLGIDWNPDGHPPANVYTLPHFDFHFYLMTEAERLAAINPNKLNLDPAADYLPANHVGADPVPQMGKHWVDVTSPELNPANPNSFTQTFIYGTYDGKVNFYEPMITKNFLKLTSSYERNIPQPAKFHKAGFYPTKMRIMRYNGMSEIILLGFVERQAN